MVDALSPDRDDPSLIGLRSAEALLGSGRIHYLGLGDRHSLTKVGESGRIWYSGSPETTDHDEEAPGHVLVVEVEGDRAQATPHRVGTWRFERKRFDLASDADVDLLEAWLKGAADKERTVLKLGFTGTLTLRGAVRLESILDEARDLFAAIEDPERHKDLAVIPEDEDFSGLEVSGFARVALDSLRARATGGGPDAVAARGALSLLVRLVKGAS
jgi:DNA repair exonuclease SbcCD nuclease subunit